ncbi:MAG: transcriptional regulator [Rhodospirillales bacterium]|nr:transcriptional regulator [Rhodospirillales bacterium]
MLLIPSIVPAAKTLTGEIRARYDRLSRTERRLADAILDFPGELASYSATELAGLAGVPKVTVTRLVRRLGFASYEAARLASRSASDGGSPLYRLRKEADAAGLPIWSAHVDRCIGNIQKLLPDLDPAALEGAIEALAKARSVWLVGYRNNQYLAGYARWQFIQVRDRVHLLPGAGETLGETLTSLAAGDLLVVLAIRRRVPVLKRIMAAATAAGVGILWIGDAHSPDEATGAAWRFACETVSLSPLDNHVAPMALLHLLSAGLLDRMGAAGRRRLAHIEALHEDLDEL